MKCPSCHYISKDEAPKFCSHCGWNLVSAVKPQKNGKSQLTLEVEIECGKELKGDDALPLAMDTVDHLPDGNKEVHPDNASDLSWTTQKTKKKNRKKKKKKDQHLPLEELDSLSLSHSALSSLSSLPSLGLVDNKTTPQESQIQEDDLTKPLVDCSDVQNGSNQTSFPLVVESSNNNNIVMESEKVGIEEKVISDLDAPVEKMEVDLHLESSQSVRRLEIVNEMENHSPIDLVKTLGSTSTEGKDVEVPKVKDATWGSLPELTSCKMEETDPLHTDLSQKVPLPESKADIPNQRKRKETSKPQMSASPPREAKIKSTNQVRGSGKEVKYKNQELKKQLINEPASSEVETQEKLTNQMKRIEEKDKNKPQDMKKQEGPLGSCVDSASRSLGPSKEYRNHNANEKELKTRTLNLGEGIRVYFHAILSRDFSFDPNCDKVFIRGGEDLDENAWNSYVCEMNCTKELGEHGFLIEGKMLVSKDQVHKSIPYKYYIVHGSTQEYEFIYKKPSKPGQHVNRCLFIKESSMRSGEWHQYDDIICMKPHKNMFMKVKDFFTDDNTTKVVKGKFIAAKIMLDNIFSILSSWNTINLNSFFSQFSQFYFVVKQPMVYEDQSKKWTSLGYGEKEMKQELWDNLKSSFLVKNSDDSFWPLKNKLKMGVIILMLAEIYTFPASEEDLISLCKLLCLDSSSRTDLCQELKDVPEANLNLKKHLVNMCQKCIEKEIFYWVWILPVMHHFVEFVDRRKDIRIQPQSTWAGLESLPFYQFQKMPGLHKAKKLLECMKEKKYLLAVDQNLFRSWFCLIPLTCLVDYLDNSVEYLTNFPASILDCLQGIYYRLEEINISYTSHEELENLFKKLLNLLNANQDKIQVHMLEPYFTVCLKFHEVVCKKTEVLKFCGLPVLSAKIISMMIRLTLLGDPQNKVNNENGNIISVKELFQETLTTTKNWFRSILKEGLLKQCSKRLSYTDELMAWSEFVKINFPNEHLSEEWKKSLLSEMEGRIKQEKPVQQIILYCSYHDHLKKVESCIAKSFETCAIEAVSPVCQSQTNILDLLYSHNLRKFGTLVSAVISKSWPEKDGIKVDDLDDVLQHLLTWPDSKHLFNLCGSDEKILEEITQDAKKLMAIADSVFTKVTFDLLNGKIFVRHMDLIEKHKKQILHLWKLKNNNLSLQEKEFDLEDVLSWRMDELQTLKRERKFVESLLKLCRKVKELIKVDFGDIEKKHLEDVSGKRMDEAVTVRLPHSPAVREYKTYYKLNSWLLEMARTVDYLKDSYVFQVCWEKEAQSLGENDDNSEMLILNLENVYDVLYSPCYRRFHRLYKDLKSGELTFADVHSVFKNFVNKYDDLTKDLKIMCRLDPDDKQDWINKRVGQIKEYHHLHLAVDSAKVICKVKEDLGLSGDFSVLQILLSFTDEFNAANEKLDRISNQLIQAKQLLQDIDETRRQCLEEISLRKEFIGWVKEALEDINELKVFVDLASISAGENDMDVDRVACFHDAVQGYASILYKLEVQAGFREFMEQLKELWKALENDQHLPKKLRDSARHLEWLKTVKDSHGSVELSSLSLATAINSKGIYIIRPPKDGQKVSLDTVLHLSLPERHEDHEEVRHYSLEELKELLNKLMLMSGKKDQNHVEVDKFSEVFCNIQRLAQAFINLYTAGNMLFRSWTATVYCSPKSQICVQMNFHLETVGQLTGNGEVTEVLAALCKQMELFLGNWKRFMIEKRSKYFYLNYYTAEQLVYLCIELKKQKPSEAALAMLSFIKKNCTKYDVLKFLSTPYGRHHMDQVNLDELKLVLFSESELMGKVKVVWDFYMSCMSAFLPNCLNIDSLGLCLAYLSEMGEVPTERHLPQGLQAGQPNLITCPHSDVLSVALAIYMESPRQPLPSYDEVLLCTPLTTYEEVSLFLRRCLTLGYQGHKVYSLLYADELSYEVSCQVEELFQNLCVQCHREDYRLVIICNSDREHCYIPSVFSQYKVLMTPQQFLMDIQDYLQSHYQVSHHIHSAASVFKDRVCVKVVTSKRAGVGKSLYVKRLHSKLKFENSGEEVPLKTIRLIEPQVNESKVLASLLPFLNVKYQKNPMLIHLDITSSVQTGIWEFLFKLLILQYLMDTNGKMWPRHKCHLYVIEILEVISTVPKRSSKLNVHGQQFSFLEIFPKVTCRPPKEVMCMPLISSVSEMEPRMDREEFCSESFQRPFQYLKRFYQGQNLDMFQYKPGSIEGTPEECLQQLLIHCGMMDPSWSELQNFSRFLNYQLRDCEASLFCNPAFIGDTLTGFKNFVVTFMILMARDFATPSLNISDQSSERQIFSMDGVNEEDIAPFCLRKRWESEPHPYIFFNDDHTSMTFIGFHLQPNQNGGIDAISHLDGKIIKRNVMTQELYKGLLFQRVPFNINFDQLPRSKKLEILCMVLGIQWPMDPDETYELTTDNILKILAIEMRFRCGIPVIIMGETGCGKTRLIKFLSDLRRGGIDAENMKLVKVHGGTSAATIYSKIREAEAVALVNRTHHQFDTILFFDEANTTEAVSCIKEVLCDNTVDGEPLFEDSGLHIIAACNPYRKHTEEMIKRLETAGLGYRVKADETVEKLGSIPLRQLVYRVHALPPSMIPLVWDFGQLNNTAERLYIQQIAQRLVHSMGITQKDIHVITEILSASQSYMRKRDNECSFVSLRDVERCVEVFKWFYGHSRLLLKKLNIFLRESNVHKNNFERDPVLWSLVLAIGVCYHASLEEKEAYWEVICKLFKGPYSDIKTVLDEISQIQDLFLSGVPLRKTIAKNLALKENIFMMVICIELRIPLFLVGKPGSSKSLAKTIVADAMQGQAAYSELFKELKQVHLVSFQCSPHSTPQGIIGTFKQCARFQQGKNLQEYVSVVVLDEVGLAEDSPKMPLKALHPLLEDGCIDDDPLPHKKVGFIGISNWALDPAKMNRGIFVSRGTPNKKELIESAKGICCSDTLIQDKIKDYFASFAEAYEVVCETQDKEFFGLRDYYSLIKMVFAMAKASNEEPTPQEIAQAVLRNFSGKDNIDALDTFTAKLPEARCFEEISTICLIWQNIYGDSQTNQQADVECRYLLVLTKNYVALQILQQAFFNENQQPEIIFGSSFPKDQEYTQICRNINRVKVCMETGKMVVLLNLQNLYESLYDALNQYYVHLGGQKYVDLGLGTHRVKCRVHPDFRLIVIEEKEVVYKQFPIPLINRLEKHYLDINTVLEKWQKTIVEELQTWVENFINVNADQPFAKHSYSPSDVFIGYHSDTCASVVLQVTNNLKQQELTDEIYARVSDKAKYMLLNCATPDAVVRLSSSRLGSFAAKALAQKYYCDQQHDSFADFLQDHLQRMDSGCSIIFTEITTFSRLLTSHDSETLETELQGLAQKPRILWLQQFDTEYSFLKEIRNSLDITAGNKILIIQTDFEDDPKSAQLIASAKYSAVNEINNLLLDKGHIFVYFITKLSRMESGASYVGFHGGLWHSVHIDDLRRPTIMVSDVTILQNVSISQLFKPEDIESTSPIAMEVEPGAEANDEDVEMETDTSSGEMETENPEMEKESSEINKTKEHTQALDTTSLLRSCVQSAMGMLKDQNDAFKRATRRVEILLSLLTENDDMKGAFLQVFKTRLFSLLKKQEENYFYNMKQWVVREASNQNALQEAGTFRHTLWKRVQNAVIPLLAAVVSFIDRDCNLELLVCPTSSPWVKALWMFIFQDLKFLNIPLMVNNTSLKAEMAPIMVQNYMKLSENVSNDVPFSWRIKDYLDELWMQAQYITNTEGLSEKFVDIFQQTNLGKFLASFNKEAQQMLLHSYLKDFLLLTMSVSTWDELQFLQIALWSCIGQLKAESEYSEEELSLPWVHLAYQHFRNRIQNFARILAIHPSVLETLQQAKNNHDLAGSEMVLDVYAALACAEMLKKDVLKPSPQIWLQMVKNLHMPFEFLCTESYMQSCGTMCRTVLTEIKIQWNQIFSMALFVEHVLLETKARLPELQNLVIEYVSLLGKCLQDNSDIKSHRPFAAVMAVLCECKDRASQICIKYGLQPCPVCLGDPKEPVCLPCDHVYCHKCIKTWLIPGQMKCPFCVTDLPDTFSIAISQEHSDAIAKHIQFRHMCNSFFIDLVSTMCFKDNIPPDKEVIEELLSLLFVHKKLLKDDLLISGHSEYTKSLSPFDDVVDKTPVIRSVVLKLLLKYSFHDVKEYIQHYLSQLEQKPFLDEDKTELYTLFINCLEDSIYEKASACTEKDRLNYLREEGHFLGNYSPLLQNVRETVNESSVEYLQDMARIRLCLDKASDFLFELHEAAEVAEEKQRYLQQVKRFCLQAGNDWYRVYLVRKLVNQHGMEFVQSLCKQDHQSQWVFPKEIIDQLRDQSGQMDRYLVCGDSYKALRDAVGKAILKHDPTCVITALKKCKSSDTQQAVYLLLAIFQELTASYRCHNANVRPTPEQCETANTFIKEAKVLFSPALKEMAKSLVTNVCPFLTVDSSDSMHKSTVTELAVHAKAVLLCGQNPILEPLKNLAFNPANMQNSFLPTMPEDLLAQAKNWKGLETVHWYLCPNGHPCSVGECGAPMEHSRCVDCGARIGGENHRAVQGFNVVRDNVDRTQSGHVLGNPDDRGVMVVSDREISPVVFILLRLLTHIAMLLGTSQNAQALIKIIKPTVWNPERFLQQHIQKDLEQLMKSLGRSADETANVVHLILCCLLKEPHHQPGQWPIGFDATLSSKERRNIWEKVVAAMIILELKCLDKTLLEANIRISQDERISSNPVAKIMYGDPATFLSHLPKKSVVHCSRIWSYRKKITVEYLQHVVEQNDGKDTVPILYRFLQKERELRLVKFLPEILALQRDLVKRFQNVSDVEYNTIRGFLRSHYHSEGLKRSFQKQIEVFLATWNMLRRSLYTRGEIKLPKEYCNADLSLESEFEILLPRRRGLGLCSTALVSYLIALHNDLVYTVRKYTNESSSYSINSSEVTDLHVISYEVERDLTPLILSNCQYSVEKGRETLQQFDLEKIQRQVTSRFLQGKPLLTLQGLPTLVYRHDRNYEHIFMDIKNKMPQKSLPNSAIGTISGQLQSYSDACEALSVAEITLGFLSTAGGDPEMHLNVYIQDILQMHSQTAPVLKALSRCQLKHTIALWQFLSAHKSEQLLRLRKDPFGEIGAAYKDDLSAENAKLLNTYLNQTGLETFLLELHEMILLKLKHTQTEGESFNPKWSLRETLVSYMETKESEIPSEMESQFPEEILLSNCIAVWKAAASLKQDRRLT